MSSTHEIGIVGLGAHVPTTVRTNEDVAEGAGVSPEWIVERTGVLQRHAAEEDEAASDLAAEAVRAALHSAGIDAGDVGLLVVGTSTPDEFGPSTACRVQAQIGAGNAVAFDVNAACSGFVFGLQVARDWLAQRGREQYVVVIGVEVYSKFLDPTDRSTAVLFGDGAGAAVLGTVPPGHGVMHLETGSDGGQAGQVLIPGGGSRFPASKQTLADGVHNIHMNGRAVRDFIVETFPRMLSSSLAATGLELADVDVVVPHQPNPLLLRHLGEQAGLPHDKAVIVGDRVGNIGAASIPVALTQAAATGRLRRGGPVLLATFGAGVTWGACLLRWSSVSRVPAAAVTQE